ncbi:MAG: putative toxin-antitoxin system toxin component, PIN family [Lentisphaeria bacterium]|nr:putative toxin-antitoxin system toxin component, PIN family [Lentisphaeria bacterium]
MDEPIAVFDTNVIVSGFLSAHGPPGRIVDWLRQGYVHAVVDDRVTAEYREVLCRPKFGFPLAEINLVLDSILSFAVWLAIPPDCLNVNLPDPDDRPFAECAKAAQCPLVTGNARHFPQDMLSQPVITPAEFVKRTMRGTTHSH